MKTAKAYSSVENANARWPKKNLTTVTKAALANTSHEDEFTHLVVAAPSVDITNLDTSKLKSTDNIDHFRQEVIVSSKNVFTVHCLATRTCQKYVLLNMHQDLIILE